MLHILPLLTQRATSVHELPGTAHTTSHLTLYSCFSEHPALKHLFTCHILDFPQPFRLSSHPRWPPKLSTSCITCKAGAALVLPWCRTGEALAEAASSSATALGVRGTQGDSSGESRKHGKELLQIPPGRMDGKIYTCLVQRKGSGGGTSTNRQMLQQRQHWSNASVFSKAGRKEATYICKKQTEARLESKLLE